MILIVEGIDKVGKTDICKQISKVYGLKYYRSPREYTNETDDILSRTKEIVNLIDAGIINNVVFDRLFISCIVYDYLFREKDTQTIYTELQNKIKDKVSMLYVEVSDPYFTAYHYDSSKQYAEHKLFFERVIESSPLEKFTTSWSEYGRFGLPLKLVNKILKISED